MDGRAALLAVAFLALSAGCLSLGFEEGAPASDEPASHAPPGEAGNGTVDDQASPDDDVDGTPGGEDEGGSSQRGGFSDTDVFPGDYEVGGDYSKVLNEGPHEVGSFEETTIESPVDGADIYVGVVRPEVPNGTEVPVVVLTSPYLQRGPLFPSGPDDVLHREERNHRHVDMLAENLVPHGYALALVSLRGTGQSGGCWDALGPKTGQDLDHVASWLANRSWSNGNLGAWGISQDGAAAWQMAATGNPNVDTVVPAAGWPDKFGWLFRNGSTSLYGMENPVQNIAFGVHFTEPPDSRADLETMASRALCPETAQGLVGNLHALGEGAGDPTGYWAERDHRDAILSSYDGSVFHIQGLRDAIVQPSASHGFVKDLREDGVPVKQLLGPWTHRHPDMTDGNPTPRWDYAEILLHWFDYWLKENQSRDLGPRVQVADQLGNWHSEESWPPPDATKTSYHLGTNGTLARETTEEGRAVVGPNPDRMAGLEQSGTTTGAPCPGCEVFETEPVDDDLRFGGAPKAHLTVTPSAPGGFLTADLYVVTDGGNVTHLTTTHMDLRFAQGGREAQEVVPGQPLVARMSLEPVDAVVPGDAHLRLVVSQGADRGTNYGQPFAWRSQPTQPTSPVVLHVGGTQSTLTLSTFERGPDAFFEPPS